jgi:hypothetical protein
VEAEMRAQIVELATRPAIPVMYADHEATVTGGLMSYSIAIADEVVE